MNHSKHFREVEEYAKKTGKQNINKCSFCIMPAPDALEVKTGQVIFLKA
jgi:hypothetical protein